MYDSLGTGNLERRTTNASKSLLAELRSKAAMASSDPAMSKTVSRHQGGEMDVDPEHAAG